MIEIITNSWPEYELLDSGNYLKLERFGDFVLIRSEPRAWWLPKMGRAEWDKVAQAEYLGEGRGEWAGIGGGPIKAPKEFVMPYQNVKFNLKLTSASKHVGVFPEQSSQWAWLQNKIAQSGRNDLKILNLFAYTGASTMVCAASGASVTHVDGSKPAMDWANENLHASGLDGKPVRWILDDCFKFVKREVRRGSRYDAIILDPPAFGRGPQGQVWKIEDSLPDLLANCRELLSEKALFVWLTAYTIDASSLSIANLVGDMAQGLGGQVRAGEMVLKPQGDGKLLPMSIYSVWEK